MTSLTGRHPGTYSETGVFVCFEGGEGSGKSTQAGLLREWLDAERYDVVLTFEPGDTEVGKRLREIVLSPDTGRLADRTEALLYAADKAEHVDRVVRPALDRGAVVITDRYVDSTLAYQGAGRGLASVAGAPRPLRDDRLDHRGSGDLEAVARWATHDLRPHLTVVLDLDPVRGLARFDGRDRIELESLEFHRRVREHFLAIARSDPDHYLVADASDPPEQIAERVLDRVKPLLARSVRR